MPQSGVAKTLSFWRGNFGDDYARRCAPTADNLAARALLWEDIFALMGPERPRSVMEVGANVGANLLALRAELGRSTRMFGVEPNDLARRALVESGAVYETDAYAGIESAIGTVDLIFTCGVMIHIPPEDLAEFCAKIHRHAGRWIVAIEYFAAEPEEKPYRGHAGKLWKRDFGSFWLDNFPDLKSLGCGFAWKRTTGLDNLTYWVFEKVAA